MRDNDQLSWSFVSPTAGRDGEWCFRVPCLKVCFTLVLFFVMSFCGFLETKTPVTCFAVGVFCECTLPCHGDVRQDLFFSFVTVDIVGIETRRLLCGEFLFGSSTDL